MVWLQRSASKANFTLALPLVTGGSWKKSPVTISYEALTERHTCMPPNGRTFFLSMLPIRDSLSNRSPSSIDTAPGFRQCAERNESN
ncbi:hypothetical protein C8R47DRAFT_976473 [Mycena vitilis]|nr:hypothetical protein C8R47DRAFT_976473 [Mycena vitilis]